MQVSGIKCDNTKCDYRDDNVKFEDYKEYLGKPCPKCEENLLTEEDLQKTVRMYNVADKINKFAHKLRWLNPLFYWYKIFGRPVDKKNIKVVKEFKHIKKEK